jgi:gas vesicle protein
MKKEIETMKDNRIALLVTGMGIGAVTALLFARYSGVELRRRISRRAGEATTFLKDQADGLVDCVTKAAEGVEHHFEKGKDIARDLHHKAKDILEDASTAATATAQEMADKSRTVASRVGR